MENSNFKRKPLKEARFVMTNKIPKISSQATIDEIKKEILNKTQEFETLNYIYVVDNEKLVGILSIKDIFALPKKTKIRDCMKKELVTARPRTSQERVALLALKNSLKAIPVVNAENYFLGIVPSDTILNILYNENIEDALRFAGVNPFLEPAKNIIKAPAILHFKKRFPWLFLGLMGGIIAAFLVGFFENLLEKKLILAAFIPLIVYIADAVGVQTQTLYIRSIVLEQKFSLRKYIFRETFVGLALASALGGIAALVSFFWQKSILIGFILGSSIFATILIAMTIALILPWFFLKIKIDPAIASGPFATIVRDILSLLIYLMIAQTLLFLFPV